MVFRYQDSEQTREEHDRFRVFIGRIIHSRSLDDLEIFRHGVLGVRPDGSIAFLMGHTPPSEDSCVPEEDFKTAKVIRLEPSQFLMPGMIDTHLHAPQWPNLALGMEGQLREWVENWTNPVEVSRYSTR